MSDSNASDFVERTTLPIFEDSGAGQPTWDEMEPGARKHDTFVYYQGERYLFWDTSSESFGNWATDIRATVESLSAAE